MKQNTIYLDLTDCTTWDDLHGRIRLAFDFPEFYGENWDAFFDLLNTEVPACHVIVTGEYSLHPDFQEQMEIMHLVLERAKERKQRRGTLFTYELRS